MRHWVFPVLSGVSNSHGVRATHVPASSTDAVAARLHADTEGAVVIVLCPGRRLLLACDGALPPADATDDPSYSGALAGPALAAGQRTALLSRR
jgi:hypothetical protein